MIPPPVAFPGIQVNPGFTFPAGVSVPASFLQSAVHQQAGGQAGKQSHIPYSQQRPSGPGASGQGPGPLGQVPSAQQQQPSPQQALQQSVQLQVQALGQQQQSPTKPGQQGGMGKSPPHHPGLQQVGTATPTRVRAGSGDSLNRFKLLVEPSSAVDWSSFEDGLRNLLRFGGL